MDNLEWHMSYHYFRYEGLLYKRVTLWTGADPSWYRADRWRSDFQGANPGDVETLINAEPMESLYQKWLEREDV